MNPTKSGTLRVLGADLYYEVWGSGPILLLIHGGGGGGSGFNGIAEQLAARYTVVTYDRRGLSHSTLDDPNEEQRVETHGEDAYRLLQELSQAPAAEPGIDGRAYVFGSSGGAVVALELAARHPERVRTVIAHEPPSHLMPEEEGRHKRVREIYRRDGPAAAFRSFVAMTGMGAFQTDREPGVELPSERSQGNIKFLIEQEFPMYDRYWLDFAALKAAAEQTRIVIAGGVAQRDAYPYRSALAVAEQLGTTLVEFPGGHAGYVTHPKAFAARLQELLTGPSAKA